MRTSGRRSALLGRRSRETEITLALDLDGGAIEVDTGIGFLDHMLRSLALHSGWGLELTCRGDLAVDDHHSAEDCALALGEAFARAVASGTAPKRFGAAYAPLDEALARAVVDISGRPYCVADLGVSSARLGGLAGENVEHILSSFALAARVTLHVDVIRGENAHHRAEAAFKALALALREAAAPAPCETGSGAAFGAEASAPASAKGRVELDELSEAEFANRVQELRGRAARDPAAGSAASGGAR